MKAALREHVKSEKCERDTGVCGGRLADPVHQAMGLRQGAESAGQRQGELEGTWRPAGSCLLA